MEKMSLGRNYHLAMRTQHTLQQCRSGTTRTHDEKYPVFCILKIFCIDGATHWITVYSLCGRKLTF